MHSQRTMPRRALVTGGASGIGLGIVQALLAQGAFVAMGDINAERLQEAVDRLGNSRALPLELDVRSPASARAAVGTCRGAFGGLDTLVNAAGVIRYQRLYEISEQDWDEIIDVNLKGVFLCCQAAAPLLIEGGRGRIVNIGSDASKMGFPLHTHYCAAKHGVIGLTKAIASQLAPFQVTANCVCPVNVPETGMGQEVLNWKVEATGKRPEEILEASAAAIPLKRNATVGDIANAVMFFLGDESAFLTGLALDVDGGALSCGLLAGVSEQPHNRGESGQKTVANARS